MVRSYVVTLLPFEKGEDKGEGSGLGRLDPGNLVIEETGAVCLEQRPALPGNL